MAGRRAVGWIDGAALSIARTYRFFEVAMSRPFPLPSLLAGALLLTAALPAQAQIARQFSSATYTGLGGSRIGTDFDNLKDSINLDVVGGFRIAPDQKWGELSAELNLSGTVGPGKNDGTGGGGGIIGGGGTCSGRCSEATEDFVNQTISLTGVYRTPGRLYGIGVAGYGFSFTNVPEIEEGGRGSFNFGGGVGFRFGRETAAIELLYQQVSDELTSIGIRLIY